MNTFLGEEFEILALSLSGDSQVKIVSSLWSFQIDTFLQFKKIISPIEILANHRNSTSADALLSRED